MNICKNCGTSTANPSFCSRSCSVTVANSRQPKRARFSNKYCVYCSCLIERHGNKYCDSECHVNHKHQVRWGKALASGVFVGSPVTIKRMLIKECGHICCICGITTWLDKPAPLVLDHVDGNSDNWSIDNLRLVCGNCDMQLPTYKSKNLGNGRHYRRQRYKEGKSY